MRKMPFVMPWCFFAGVVLLSVAGLSGQAVVDGPKSQEDFALAVARAHSRTSLFTADSKPVSIEAKAVSRLALHGTGSGSYVNNWVDAQHWQRKISFPDFEESEMRNDSGHSWVERSGHAVPIRVSELLNFVVIHVPSSTNAARFNVSESSGVGAAGEALTCFSASQPNDNNGFARHFRWCFDSGTGLLASEDLPFALHVAFGNYVEFQGKQEYTSVHVSTANLRIMDINIRYSPLDPHALDGLTQLATMRRSESAGAAPNPEEFQPATVEYSYNPPLPPDTPATLKGKPAVVQFYLDTEAQILDATVEDAPSDAMAEAALDGARKYVFTPLLVDGKPVRNRTVQSIWFQDEAANAHSAVSQSGETSSSAGVRDGAQGSQSGVYRNEELEFTFAYPGDFVPIPREELEADRSKLKQKTYSLVPHTACNTLLLKSQRLLPGSTSPEVITLMDLEPLCIFGALDDKALKSVAVNGAQSIADQWTDPVVSKPREFRANGKFFFAVSASGIAHTTVHEEIDVLIIVTATHGHVLAWQFVGSNHDIAQIAQACTLQMGELGGMHLLPSGVNP